MRPQEKKVLNQQNMQKTIEKEVFCEGVGVHSGKKVKVTIKPAPVNHGIKFVRVDSMESSPISALFKKVLDTSLATVIGNNGIIVSTVEHLLASFRGLEIDNALVCVDSFELPILDGSAKLYTSKIQEAGVKTQSHLKQFFVIKKKVLLEEQDKRICIEPYSKFKITCTIDYPHPLIQEQNLSLDINPESFKKEIAPARTFGFLKEYELLKIHGLGRGASLETGIALDKETILNKEPLRYHDEFVRHKILDCIGDFSLIGMPILGHITTYKSGHNFHSCFIKKLFEEKDAWDASLLDS